MLRRGTIALTYLRNEILIFLSFKQTSTCAKLRNSSVIGQVRDCTGAKAGYRKKSRRKSPPIDGLQTHSNGSRHGGCLPILCVCLLNLSPQFVIQNVTFGWWPLSLGSHPLPFCAWQGSL